MVYNAYTIDEEKHLVEFLALNNPDVKGRSGNKIYRELVENPNLWPWSVNHSWQSWRDHYVKNQAVMDKKIGIFQEKRAMSGGQIDGKNVLALVALMAQGDELSGSGSKKRAGEVLSNVATNVKKRKRMERELNEGRHALVPNEKDAVMADNPAMQESPQPLNGIERELPVEGAPSEHKAEAEDTEERKEVDQMLVISKGNNSTLLSDRKHQFQEGSSTKRLSSTARKVPLSSQSDDSFNSLFDSDSDILAPDSKESDKVPSITTKHRGQQDDFFRSSSEDTTGRPVGNVVPLPRRRQPPTLKEGPFGTKITGITPEASPKEKDEDGINVASSWPPTRQNLRAKKLPENQRKQAEEHSRQPEPDRVEAVPSRREHLHENNRQNYTMETHDTLPRISQRQDYSSPASQGLRKKGNPGLESNEHPASPPPVAPAGKGARSPKPMAQRTSNHFNSRQIEGSSGSGHSLYVRGGNLAQDASMDASATEEGRVGMSQNRKLVDLLDRRRKEFLRGPTDSFGPSRSASVSPNHSLPYSGRESPLSLQLSTRDQSLVTSLGIQQAIAMMSKNHGFTEDIVSNILQNVSSIARADEVLRLMRVKAEEEAAKQLMEDEPHDQRSASKARQNEPFGTVHKLEIYAKSNDEQMLDYWPPPKTRAGQFTRLVEQGRHSEAYAREARRASGAMSPVKWVPLSAKGNGSPSPRRDQNGHKESEPEALQDGVFLECQPQEENIEELRDAHAAMAGALKKTEVKSEPQRALHRFQWTAMFLKQVLADNQDQT